VSIDHLPLQGADYKSGLLSGEEALSTERVERRLAAINPDVLFQYAVRARKQSVATFGKHLSAQARPFKAAADGGKEASVATWRKTYIARRCYETGKVQRNSLLSLSTGIVIPSNKSAFRPGQASSCDRTQCRN
jgi:hypothetical protein